MNPQPTNFNHSKPDSPVGHLSPVHVKQPASPRLQLFPSTSTPASSANRRIAIAVDLSDESAFVVKWAVQNYLRPGDAVILLHVCPTSVFYGADWGFHTPTSTTTPSCSPCSSTPTAVNPLPQQQLEEDYDNFTNTKATSLAQPLVEANLPFKIHIVKDRDLKERLCLEVERLGLSAMIMGSRGFGASRRSSKGRLGSVSDYCVHHCVCPVMLVRYPDEKGDDGRGGEVTKVENEAELQPVPEEEQEYVDADDHEQQVVLEEDGNSEGKELKE